MEGLGVVALGLAALAAAWWRRLTPQDPGWQLFGARMREREGRVSRTDRGARSLILAGLGVFLVVVGLVRLLADVT